MENAGLVNIDFRVLLATVVNFIIFFLLLKKFFYQKVKDMLAQRQEDVSTEIAEAASKKADTEKLRLEYEGLLADIKSQEREIIREANAEAQAQRHEIVEKARTEAKNIFDKGLSEIELEKRKAMNEVKGNIVDLSIFAAEKIIQKSMDQEQHEAMILDFIDKVGEA